jgi:hypothetical protein
MTSKGKIAATTITLLVLLVAAFATRHHYERGPDDALFRINRYTGETCRLFLMTPEQRAKYGGGNPLDALNPSLASASSYGWAACGK